MKINITLLKNDYAKNANHPAYRMPSIAKEEGGKDYYEPAAIWLKTDKQGKEYYSLQINTEDLVEVLKAKATEEYPVKLSEKQLKALLV